MGKEIISYAICYGETLVWSSTNIDAAVAYYNQLGGNDSLLRFVVVFETIQKSIWWD